MECTLVDPHPDDSTPLETLLAPTAGDLVAGVRTLVAEGSRVVVEPDELCMIDDVIDLDEWIALTAVLVHEGVAAIRTSVPKHARRLFDTAAALRSGDAHGESAT